jgi:hypothetical protein
VRRAAKRKTLFIILVKIMRNTRLVYRITDFYPEVLIAELGRRPWLLAIERLTWFLRRRVDAFEVLGEDQHAILIAGGIAPDRIHLKRDVSPVQIRGDEESVETAAPLKGLQVLLYSGNYSVAHDSDTVVGGLIRHHSGRRYIRAVAQRNGQQGGPRRTAIARGRNPSGPVTAGSVRRIAAAAGYCRRSPDFAKAGVLRHRPSIQGVWLHRVAKAGPILSAPPVPMSMCSAATQAFLHTSMSR